MHPRVLHQWISALWPIRVAPSLGYVWLQRSVMGLGGLSVAIAPLIIQADAAVAQPIQWRFDPASRQLEVQVPTGTTPNYFLLARPARIVLDLPNTTVRQFLEEQAYSGVVRTVRVGQFQPTLTRIVVELSPDAVLAPAQVELRQVADTDSATDRWVLRPLLAGDAPVAAIEPVPPTTIPEGVPEPESNTTGTVLLPAREADSQVSTPEAPATSGDDLLGLDPADEEISVLDIGRSTIEEPEEEPEPGAEDEREIEDERGAENEGENEGDRRSRRRAQRDEEATALNQERNQDEDEDAELPSEPALTESLPPPPLEPGAFEIPVEIPPPLPEPAPSERLVAGDGSSMEDEVDLPVAIAPGPALAPAAPAPDALNGADPLSAVVPEEDLLEASEDEVARRIEAETPEELQQALDQALSNRSEVEIVLTPRSPADSADDGDPEVESDPELPTEPTTEPPGPASDDASISAESRRPGPPDVLDGVIAPEVEQADESEGEDTDAAIASPLPVLEAELPESGLLPPVLEVEPEIPPTAEPATESNAASGRLQNDVEDESEANDPAASAPEFPRPEERAIAPPSASEPEESDELAVLPPANLDLEQPVSVDIPSLDVPAPPAEAEAPQPEEAAAAAPPEPPAPTSPPPAAVSPESSAAASPEPEPPAPAPPAAASPEPPAPAPPPSTAALPPPESAFPESPVPVPPASDVLAPEPSPSPAPEPPAPVPAPAPVAPSPAAVSPAPAPSTAARPVIEFGQPIATAPGVSGISRPSEPVVGDSVIRTDRELIVAAQAGALIPEGTVLTLRYPRLTPTVLQTGIAWQDVLLLEQTVRDRSGRVIAAEGSQVIGRFEITDRQVRFVTQAIALDGRNIPLQAISGWISIPPDSQAILIRPNQIVNVRLADGFSR